MPPDVEPSAPMVLRALQEPKVPQAAAEQEEPWAAEPLAQEAPPMGASLAPMAVAWELEATRQEPCSTSEPEAAMAPMATESERSPSLAQQKWESPGQSPHAPVSHPLPAWHAR